MTIGPVGATPFVPPTLNTQGVNPTASGTQQAAGGQQSPFANALQQIEQTTTDADTAAQGVATGNINDLHQFTIAAAKANLAVQLTAAVRNHAVEAYQDIMRMQV